jgi:dTDP-4-amino-4,6-dideoxygalactose transaminase
MSRIYLSPPDVRPVERKMLLDALDSGWVAPAGPDIDAFEEELADRCGVEHAVAVSSGTAALHLALLLAGVQPGDDVLVPTFTFAATANAVVYCGGRPCFIDSEARTWNLDPELLRGELDERRRQNRLPAAVVTVDLYGQCAAYEEIVPLCEELEIPIVEDAAEALGASWQSRPAGSFGRFGVLSFNGNKIITTSGGGALLADDEAAADRARYLATQARQPFVHYEHTEVGFNYRLSNLLAAFGRGQLAGLTDRIERRATIRTSYESLFHDRAGIVLAPLDPRGSSNHWLTCVTLDADVVGIDREALRVGLERADIESRPTWKPLHLQAAYAESPARLSGVSEEIFRSGLCLPSGSGLSDGDVARVVAAIEALLP